MKFRISIGQINPKSGDISGNASKIINAIQQAERDSADLLVLPEMCLTGYCLDEKLLMNLAFLADNKSTLEHVIAPAARNIDVIVGFVDYDTSKTGPLRKPVRYNAAALLQKGKISRIIHKRLLPSYRYFDDKRYFKAGADFTPVEINTGQGAVKAGILICEDLWDENYEVKPSRELVDRGAEYIFCVNASPFVCSSHGARDGKRFVRDKIIRDHVRDCEVPIVWVNTVGIGDNGKNIITFDGQSCAYDRQGEIAAMFPAFVEHQETVEFNSQKGVPVKLAPYDREQEIYEALVMSVRDYYDKLGIFSGVMEAVSGGIDSALGAAIACDAVGPENVKLYNLPSRYNSDLTKSAAKDLADNLGAVYKVMPIQEILELMVGQFESRLHPIENSLTEENLQARIRGTLMMAESNDTGQLLLTNGNESEMALGYATLYGDMVGGIAVIGDLSKPDVYRISRYVNRRHGREIIPGVIFEIPASAELKDDQVDPFDYEVIGPLVNDFIEKGASPGDILEGFVSRSLNPGAYPEDIYEKYDEDRFRNLVEDIYGMIGRAVYKRVQSAPIVVVSERAFGFDLREAIINGWDVRRASR
jgi:NAD+ synthase (glutamine-hydrolysing)